LDDNIVKIDNERIHIERFEAACPDMEDEIHQFNKEKGTHILDTFITRLDQMARHSKSIDSSFRLSKIQDLRPG
jgi:hypothetical protein